MSKSIKCPNCGVDIDVNEILYHQLEDELKQKNLAWQKKIKDEVEQKRAEYRKAFNDLKAKEESLKEQEEKFQRELKRATEAKVQEQLEIEKKKFDAELKAQKQKFQDELAKKLKDEHQEQIELMAKELEEKSKQLQDLHKAQAEVQKLKREKEELKAKAEAEAQIALNKALQEEKAKIEKSLNEQNELKLKQKDEQIEQMKRDIEAAKRKAEQASMQTQGEALELTIENWLREQFVFDTIEEVKKGAFGADCVQVVHTREAQNCGVICYESKNTKSWSDAWIPKLKQDMLKVNADIGVLVTSVYPNGMSRMGFVDGIWVCSLDEFKGSVSLLRESLIRVHNSIKKEENKADKMTLLYNYLTGNEFQMQLRAIVDGFMQMQNELDKEKRSLMASWKRRQKLIDSVLQNTTEMYGSLQGIAGSGAIAHIDSLELPEDIQE